MIRTEAANQGSERRLLTASRSSGGSGNRLIPITRPTIDHDRTQNHSTIVEKVRVPEIDAVQ